MRKKLTIEFVRQDFESKGYILITKYYENAKQKLEYICPNGHRSSMCWNNWKSGKRCPLCANKGRNKKDFDAIKKSFKENGCILLTDEYKGNIQKLDYICPNGHLSSISWAKWQQGGRCKYCTLERQARRQRKCFEDIKKSFKSEGCTLLTLESEYKNAHQKLNYICSNGHFHSVAWTKWQQGRRCPQCSNKTSKWEKEIKKFISDIKVKFVANDRTQIINPKTNCGLELDIWFPQLNKAIECNGEYWHSLEKVIVHDQIKQQFCTEQGIDLLVVTDKEWNTDIESCKIKLTSFVEAGVFYAW